MADLQLNAFTTENATGTALKTLLQIIAPANQRLKVKGFSVSFKGVTSSDPPILAQVVRQTSAGTVSACTPVKLDSSKPETIQSTAGQNASAEPTATSVIYQQEVHPQQSLTVYFPFGEEIIVPGGTRLGISVTATVSVSAVAQFFYEE